MRLFILIILLAALILPGAALAAPTAQTSQTAIVTADTLNVRCRSQRRKCPDRSS